MVLRSDLVAPGSVMNRARAGASARFGALRLAPFRRFWLGSAASVGGFQLLIM